MRTVGQIVRERRESLGLTLAALAQEIGATKGYLSMIENHKVAHPPSRAVLEALERALDIADGELLRSAAWAQTPQEMRAEIERLADSARRGQELAQWLKQASPRRGDGARSLDKLFRSGELSRRVRSALSPGEAPSLDPAVPVRFRVPLINQVVAGYPRDFSDLGYPARVADEYVSCPDLADAQAFAARVVGDSMQPDYLEGDIVVFSPAASVTDGCDCFVRLEPDHETTFKRVFFDKATIRLQPLNAKYPPRLLPREQVAGLYRAVWKMQRL